MTRHRFLCAREKKKIPQRPLFVFIWPLSVWNSGFSSNRSTAPLCLCTFTSLSLHMFNANNYDRTAMRLRVYGSWIGWSNRKGDSDGDVESPNVVNTLCTRSKPLKRFLVAFDTDGYGEPSPHWDVADDGCTLSKTHRTLRTAFNVVNIFASIPSHLPFNASVTGVLNGHHVFVMASNSNNFKGHADYYYFYDRLNLLYAPKWYVRISGLCVCRVSCDATRFLRHRPHTNVCIHITFAYWTECGCRAYAIALCVSHLLAGRSSSTTPIETMPKRNETLQCIYARFKRDGSESSCDTTHSACRRHQIRYVASSYLRFGHFLYHSTSSEYVVIFLFFFARIQIYANCYRFVFASQ